MSQDLHLDYRCPKCGATTALVLRRPPLAAKDVALKCIECAHVTRVPRDQVVGPSGPVGSTDSVD